MSCHPGACTVFQAALETDSERSEGEHEDIQDGIYQDTHLCFEPDAKSDSADSDAEEEVHHSLQLIWYKNGDMEAVRAFNVATINCVISWVKIGKWWGIVDHSAGPPQIMICDIQEPEYESEDSFSISCSV